MAATLRCGTTQMEVQTTQPAVVCYTGNFLPAGQDSKHRQHAAVCLETCMLPDAVNQKNTGNGWPKNGGVLKMGETYEHTTIHKFSHL